MKSPLYRLQRALQQASLCVVAALLAMPDVSLGHGGAPTAMPTGRAAPIVVGSTPARELTTALLAMRGRHASPDAPGGALAELLELARQRQTELATLVHVDPAEVLRVAMPAEVRASLPPQAAPFLEREEEELGDLEVLHVDHADGIDDHYLHFVHTPKGKVSLHFADQAPDLVSGMKVRAQGMKIGTALALRGEDLVVTQAAALPNTLGAQKTLVILVNFSNAPTAQPYTVAQAQSIVFGSTSSYDYEVSYQQTSLTGTVAGWFTIAEPNTTCNYGNIGTQAKQKASAAGYALSNYNRFVYVFPANACGWWGMGSVGGNPSQAWVHTKSGFTLQVVAHEMGHNFGLYHSHSLDCGTSAIAASGCSSSDYGDVLDVMGWSVSAHFNAFQKERLGWLNAGVSPPITTVPALAGTATYSIAPLENARDGTSRALKIPRGTSCSASNDWFYVEARQPKGFDSYLASYANVISGVLIHKVTGGSADGYLLDMTPATSSFSDAALVAGQSFTDPQSGIKIMPVSVGSGGATINVTFGAGSCTRAAPKVVLTPTGTVWTSSGAAVNYAASVTNQDGCGCGSTPFDVSAVVPSGWTSTSARTASIAPGASASASVIVHTASSAVVAFYPVSVKGANTSAPTLAATVNSTVAIASALTVAVAPDKPVYTAPKKGNGAINAIITTQATSGGTAMAGAPTVVEVRDPAGKLTTYNGTTDAGGRVVVEHAMKARTAVKGGYTITSRVTMGSLGGTATGSFVVN